MATLDNRDADRVIGFTLPNRQARGRLVRLDRSLGNILDAHAYPDTLANLLSETLVLTSLLGNLLRPEGGQLTVQARGENGPVKLLVADFREGDIRGYAAQNLDQRFELPEGDITLGQLFGAGHLVITLDQSASSERYQGIVELGDLTLEKSAQSYFENSEQLPTYVRLAAAKGADGRWTAGGLIVQYLPRSEEGKARLHVDETGEHDWDHVLALASTVQVDELVDVALPLDTLLWRLFNEDEVRVLPAMALQQACRCSPEHIESVLLQFSEEDRAGMRDENGDIIVDCEFCSKKYVLKV